MSANMETTPLETLTAMLDKVGLPGRRFSFSASNSLRGPCPECGGKRRMVIYLNGNFPEWWVSCDLCSFGGWVYKLWEGKFDGFTPSKIDWAAALQQEKARKAELSNKILADSQGLPEKYHKQLTKQGRKWWSDRGIYEEFQDFWKVGETNKVILNEDKLETHHCYTIPRWGPDWELNGIDHRLLNPPEGSDKYRGLQDVVPGLFFSRPDMEHPWDENGRAIITEGSIKAGVTSIQLGFQPVLGVPSANNWAGVADVVKGASEVLVILDPDAWSKAQDLVQRIGGGLAKSITLPDKIDDLFTSGALTRESFERIVTISGRR